MTPPLRANVASDVRVRVEEISTPEHPGADLLAYFRPGGFYFEHDGEGIVASGVAAAILLEPGDGLAERAAEAAQQLLRTVGEDCIVVGALPFDERSKETILYVPRVAIVRRGGRCWGVLAGDESLPTPIWPSDIALPPITSRVADPSPQDYVASVADAVAQIRAGALEKVVLARSLIVHAKADPRVLLRRLRDADRASYAFCVDGMIGASPELLIAKSGRAVRSQPLAGSARRGMTGPQDAEAARRLLDSAKDKAEHAFVANAVAEALAPLCETIAVEAAPSAIATSRVWHLATEVNGSLRDPMPNVLALAARLHPTPAVCGTPRDRALDAIRKLERIDRGLYAGMVGWMDGKGDGEWAIALRCAHLDGDTSRLYAGSGIVAASDPEAELAETDAKFEVLLRALGASDEQSRSTQLGATDERSRTEQFGATDDQSRTTQ